MIKAPVHTTEVELSEHLPHLRPPIVVTDTGLEQASSMRVLIRLHRHPVGTLVVPMQPGGVGAAELAELIWTEAGPGIAAHLAEDGLDSGGSLGTSGYPIEDTPACWRRRDAVLESAQKATVIVATRERPDKLRLCLESLDRLHYPAFEVVVVDNDPESNATASMVKTHFGDRVRYVREYRRGLAAAHNRGIEEARGHILAFTDDDVVVDREWLGALAEGFRRADRVGAVSGLIHPGALKTPAQVLLEQHGDFTKGFVPKVFDLKEHRPDDPLFPFTAGQLGSGANMAFDASVLRRMGGFDPALGTGTLARGGDDLMALFSVVAGGHQVVYEPSAVVYHYHHEDMAALPKQAFGYGVGLGAYLTDAVIHHPRLAAEALTRLSFSAPSFLRGRSERSHHRYSDWPADAGGRERRGVLISPAAYAASCWRARDARRPLPSVRTVDFGPAPVGCDEMSARSAETA